jgi:hypothetical protein
MASHVAEAFLGYTVETACNLLRNDWGDILMSEAAPDTASSCEVVHQPLQGDGKAQVVENGGMKLIGQVTHYIGQLHNPVLYLLDSPTQVIR